MVKTVRPPGFPGDAAGVVAVEPVTATRVVLESSAGDFGATRRTLRHRLRSLGIGDATVTAVEQAAAELLGAVLERAGPEPVDLEVACFRVRVSSRRPVDLGDEPFGLRERIVGAVALAWGRRMHADGSIDPWAEVARER